MALDTFIAGRYTGTYNSVDVGITEDGYKIEKETFMEVIQESDAYGQTPIDGIWRGGRCHCDFVCLAYKAGSLAPFWPYGNTPSVHGTVGVLVDPSVATKSPIGILATTMSKSVVLTSVTGTPAAAAPATLTATQALLRENFPAAVLFTTKLRKVPIGLRFWPADVGSGVIKFFATT